MYKENSRGPRVEPYGTPHTIVLALEGILLQTVNC